MSGDDIIRLAVEARLVCNWDGGCASAWVEGHDLTPYLERFAALVAAAEREACAMEADYEAARWPYAPECREPCEEIAAAIRARGQE